jgi:thiol:disulfide interchange protein
MTAVVGLVMMGMAFFVAVRLSRASRWTVRAGTAFAMGTGALLVFADMLRPDLMPLAMGALCVSLLWLGLASPEDELRAAKARRQIQHTEVDR